MNIKEMAAEIAQARKSGEQTQLAWPEPAPDVSDAMEIQSLAFAKFGSPSMGWKVGATNKPAQETFKIDAPFYGPMAVSGLLTNGDTLKVTKCIGACEPEYAFKLARDYPVNGEEITRESASSAVQEVHIVIEIIGRCIGNPDFANGVGVTMDFGGNAAFVVGPKVEDWQNKDFANAVVESKLDGKTVQTGNGKTAMDDPINSLVWLAQQLAAKGTQIKSGEWVSTGTCTAAVPAEAGKTYSASFGTFGEVSIRFN